MTKFKIFLYYSLYKKVLKEGINEISADEALRRLAIDRIMIEADKKQFEYDAHEAGKKERNKRTE